MQYVSGSVSLIGELELRVSRSVGQTKAEMSCCFGGQAGELVHRALGLC